MTGYPSLEDALAAVAVKECPSCNRVGSLTIEEQWLPLGPAHVAGVQMKMSAQRQWLLTCTHCGPLGTLRPAEPGDLDEDEGSAPD